MKRRNDRRAMAYRMEPEPLFTLPTLVGGALLALVTWAGLVLVLALGPA